MKKIGYILMILGILTGVLTDIYLYPNVEFGIFISFLLFLISLYVLILEDKRNI